MYKRLLIRFEKLDRLFSSQFYNALDLSGSSYGDTATLGDTSIM